MHRIYVSTVVQFDIEGKITPLWIVWSNGRKYEIDRILSTQNTPSLRPGANGYRFHVRILGQERTLGYDGRRWYIEVVD